MMNKNNREVFIYMFVGANRSGKSVTALELAKEIKKSKNKEHIVCYDPQNRFTDVLTEKTNSQEWAKYFDYTNTLFIIDDYRAYMGENTIDKDFLNLLGKRAEQGLDFIFITWHTKLVHERLTYFITHYFLFFINGTDEKMVATDRVQGAETILQITKLLRDNYQKITPDNYEKLYPKFPFAYVDNNRNEVSFVNMPNIKVETKSPNNYQINY